MEATLGPLVSDLCSLLERRNGASIELMNAAAAIDSTASGSTSSRFTSLGSISLGPTSWGLSHRAPPCLGPPPPRRGPLDPWTKIRWCEANGKTRRKTEDEPAREVHRKPLHSLWLNLGCITYLAAKIRAGRFYGAWGQLWWQFGISTFGVIGSIRKE